ncbi:MAG: aminotransferase class I/II-fold pyridoxal phosphate-dependent enzyme [Bacteroidota bacterium]|nr:aminotransferase class I/II-fold pyridoxal phosphate-dependent enzyme [Bacteroidota bacterium]
MSFNPAVELQKIMNLSPFDGVNPVISDSATFVFSKSDVMTDTFEGKTEGCFLYSRHWNPTNMLLANALAAMEGAESGWVTGSGMSAITSTILQICNTGDHIISANTTYGGTYAFFRNYLPAKFNIEVSFVNITDLEAVKKEIRPNTKIIYTESMTNPLLQISDLPLLSKITKENNLKLVVDNTFTPMMISPLKLGADVVVYSMTKYINGKNDCVAGAICGSEEFINSMIDVNDGTAMLLGPVLDPPRAASILKNLHTLHIRMQKHSFNAAFLAQKFKDSGVNINYPGLPDHPGHKLLSEIMNPYYGFGGMIAIDLETTDKASDLMACMQEKGVGYLAVSLGYFKTLFSNSGTSTSSEVPIEEQKKMGLSEGLVRFSVGLDMDIEMTWNNIESCLKKLKMI